MRTPLVALTIAALGVGCAPSGLRPFRFAEPLAHDADLQSKSVPCRVAPSDDDPRHVSCAPADYVSPLIWDGADNLVFRPFAEVWAVRAPSEAANANSLDEVADSAWFTNRIGVRDVPLDELTRAACEPGQILHPDDAPDGAWLVDKGKTDGSSLGFRVKIDGKKYLFKVDTDAPERPSTASTIGAAAYQAAGFNTSCEQVVFFRPALLKLKPGLKSKANFTEEKDFDQAALDHIVSLAPRRGDKVRFQASAWLPGKTLGPFKYDGVRDDDPNDVVRHEDRRELRGGRVLAAWLDHFDAREQNSMDTWMSDRKDAPDASPGHIVHYYLDTSDCLGSAWDWEQITRRLGHSYVVDWGDIGRDFLTLGIPLRPWDRAQRTPGREQFNYFDVANFDPDAWKNEYANPAFDRATERDEAWMARILAGLSPEHVKALVGMGRLEHAEDATFLAGVLEGRLQKILGRYLTRLSPLGNVHIEGDDLLCATDRAELRHVRPPASFQYAARRWGGEWMTVERRRGGGVCVHVPHVAPTAGPPDADPSRYVRVIVSDGVARSPAVAHLFDLGPGRGYKLVGLERPDFEGR